MKTDAELRREREAQEAQRTRMRNLERNPVTGERNRDYVPPIGSKSGGGCFPGSTMIKVPSGQSTIADLSAGDSVLSLNVKTQVLEAKKILYKWSSKTQRNTLRLHFSSGQKMDVTDHHSILTNKGWLRIANIPVGGKVGFTNAQNKIVYSDLVSIEKLDPSIVYNLVIEDNFNFIAENCVAHSFTYFRSLRSALWTMSCIINKAVSNIGIRYEGHKNYLPQHSVVK